MEGCAEVRPEVGRQEPLEGGEPSLGGQSVRNLVALSIGVLIMLVAVAAEESVLPQDTASQPEIAQEFATALHQSPSPFPPPTPTLLRITQLLPTREQVLDLLFPPSDAKASINTRDVKLLMRLLTSDGAAASLIIAGEDAIVSASGRTFPIAFGAILAREHGEYVTKYLEVEWGEREPHVEYAPFNDGSIAFHFFNLGRDAGHDLQDQRTVTVYPCRTESGVLVMQGLEQQTREDRASRCF